MNRIVTSDGPDMEESKFHQELNRMLDGTVPIPPEGLASTAQEPGKTDQSQYANGRLGHCVKAHFA